MDMNPFEILGVAPGIILDLASLRTRYIQLQKEGHPDLGFDGNISELANKAYTQLKNLETRLEQLLIHYGTWPPNPNDVDFDFLDLAMELGDAIDSLNEGNEIEKARIIQALTSERELLQTQIEAIANESLLDSKGMMKEEMKLQVSVIYQKSKYITRLEKNLRGELEI